MEAEKPDLIARAKSEVFKRRSAANKGKRVSELDKIIAAGRANKERFKDAPKGAHIIEPGAEVTYVGDLVSGGLLLTQDVVQAIDTPRGYKYKMIKPKGAILVTSNLVQKAD